MLQKNNCNDGDVHLENPQKPPKTLKTTPKPTQNPPKTSKTPKKKPQNLEKPSKTPNNLKVIQTSQNNQSRWFGKIIATMAIVGNVKK